MAEVRFGKQLQYVEQRILTSLDQKEREEKDRKELAWRVDIILWDDNPAQFVINAMLLADVVSILIDEESDSMDVAVNEENLSQAIGRGGQNVRLASQLTGWELNVMNEAQAAEKSKSEARTLMKSFKEQLGVDEDVATILVQEGFTNLDEAGYVPVNEMLSIQESKRTWSTPCASAPRTCCRSAPSPRTRRL